MTFHAPCTPATELEGLRCECCDAPRQSEIAFCDSCQELTASYRDPYPHGSVCASQLEASVMEDLSLAPVVRLSATQVIA